jgi:hypothetical protein
MNERIHVHYDAKAGQFQLSCPFYANEMVRGANARWSKAKRAWMAPNVRRNVEYINTTLRPYADFTSEAETEIAAALKRYANMAATKGGFPSWYPFKTAPMPHQQECLGRLYGKEGVAVFMDPGLGKSKVLIDLNCALRMEDKIDRWLILTKVSLLDNFADQIREHAPIPVDIHIPDTTKVKAYQKWLSADGDFKCLIAGIESLSNGRMIDIVESFLLCSARPAVSIDESSMIATHNATRSVRVIGLRSKTAYRQASTGTPIADSPLNLFMQFQFIDPDIIGIGDYYAFRNRYAVMGGHKDPKTGKPVQIVGYQNIDELTKTVAPYTYEQNKSILKLPERRYQVRKVELAPTLARWYREVKVSEKYQINGKTVVPQNILEYILRLHQIAGGFIGEPIEETLVDGRIKKRTEVHQLVLPKDNTKLIELLDVVGDYKNKQMIIWTAYRCELQMVASALSELYGADKVTTLHGDTDDEQRRVLSKHFERGDYQFIVSNPQTGGMGFTWNAASAMVYYSMTNKLIDRLQSLDRNNRIGQTKSTMVIDIVAKGTVDELIKKANDQKFDLAQFVRSKISSYGRGHYANALDTLDRT